MAHFFIPATINQTGVRGGKFMGFSRVPWAVLLLLIFFFSFPGSLLCQTTEGDPCDQAIESYQQTYNSFQSLSEACVEEAGKSPAATVEDCPSIDKGTFVSLILELGKDHDWVCQGCNGIWPEKDLGLGTCLKK